MFIPISYLNSVELISKTTANEVKSGVKLLITNISKKVRSGLTFFDTFDSCKVLADQLDVCWSGLH